jgi:putative membrane protein
MTQIVALLERNGRVQALTGLVAMLVTVAGLFRAEPTLAQSNVDRAFVAWVIQIEIQQQDMGRIAERRAPTGSVRGLGEYLVERHGRLQQRLQQIANQLNMRLSTELSSDHLQVQRRFSTIASAKFDQAFIRHEIADYRYFMAHFEAAARSGSGAVQQYAASEIPRLEEDQARIAAIARRRA